MTSFTQLSDTFFTAPQIDEAAIDAAHAMGIKTIICNRPDDEEPGQPASNTLKSYAENHGMTWKYMPISGGISMDMLEDISESCAQGQTMLAFCKSGTRSCMLWCLAAGMKGETETQDILQKARNAGYNVEHLAPTIEQLRASANK